jgi:LPXTG-site transpeptidase (sortase) family protein
MKARAAEVAAISASILGFLVGDSLTDQEPGIAATQPVHIQSAVSRSFSDDDLAWPQQVPYSDSRLPAQVVIPELDIAADVRPVGMTDATTMQVPSDISVVGWFDDSVLPISTAGNTVLVGHRDGVEDPNGVFRHLGDLQKGDLVEVEDLSQEHLEYEVTRVDVIGRDEFAGEAPWIFNRIGKHHLVLLTCGGSYDASRGGYQANVIVVAKRT